MKWSVVFIGAVIILLVLTFLLSYGTPNTEILPAKSTSSVEILKGVKTELYSDAANGFSIQRPETASTTKEGFEGFFTVAKDPMVGIYLPQKLFSGTNLVEAGVFVGASKDDTDTASCLQPQGQEHETGSRRIGNSIFKGFSSLGAAAGNTYDTTAYRAIHGGKCFELVEVMHAGNIGNYPEGSVKQYEPSTMRTILDTLLNTFTFSGTSGSGIIGKLSIKCSNSTDKALCTSQMQTIQAYQGISSVALFKTAPDGTFSSELPPGRYELRVDTTGTTRCASVGIVVTEGAFSSANISCISGV